MAARWASLTSWLLVAGLCLVGPPAWAASASLSKPVVVAQPDGGGGSVYYVGVDNSGASPVTVDYSANVVNGAPGSVPGGSYVYVFTTEYPEPLASGVANQDGSFSIPITGPGSGSSTFYVEWSSSPVPERFVDGSMGFTFTGGTCYSSGQCTPNTLTGTFSNGGVYDLGTDVFSGSIDSGVDVYLTMDNGSYTATNSAQITSTSQSLSVSETGSGVGESPLATLEAYSPGAVPAYYVGEDVICSSSCSSPAVGLPVQIYAEPVPYNYVMSVVDVAFCSGSQAETAFVTAGPASSPQATFSMPASTCFGPYPLALYDYYDSYEYSAYVGGVGATGYLQLSSFSVGGIYDPQNSIYDYKVTLSPASATVSPGQQITFTGTVAEGSWPVCGAQGSVSIGSTESAQATADCAFAVSTSGAVSGGADYSVTLAAPQTAGTYTVSAQFGNGTASGTITVQ